MELSFFGAIVKFIRDETSEKKDNDETKFTLIEKNVSMKFITCSIWILSLSLIVAN